MDSSRRTKIVATLGPATDDDAVMAGMVQAGLDVARINFSHGTRDAQRRQVERVRAAAKAAGRYIGVLADLAGPKIRIESFRDGKVQLVEGAPFALDTRLDPQAGTPTEVGCAYTNLPADVRKGDTLLLNDGQIVLDVERVAPTRIECVVRVGGELSNRKGLNRQGGGISAPALTEKDMEDIRLAAELGIDFLAVSFARDGDDLRTTVKVPLYTALLGGETTVPTLAGPAHLTIPPETRNGQRFRLAGRGMPKLRAPSEHGDLFVTVDVDLPRGLTDEEKRLFGELARLREAV